LILNLILLLLFSDEVEIRAHKNVALSPAVDFVTLRQWYNQHNVAGVREVYLKTPAGIKGGKGSTFSLELFIHEDRVRVIYHLARVSLTVF
jgi:hypothetical protein